MQQYDQSDLGHRVLVDDNAGVVTSADPSFPSQSDVPLSTSNWSVANYQPVTTSLRFDTFLSYVRSRKHYMILTFLSSNLAEINNNTDFGIFYYDASSNPLTITAPPTKNTVLLVKGAVTISQDLLTTTQGFALLVAGSITVAPTVKELDGVYSATTFNTGQNNTVGLKIKGNLITNSFTQGRSQINNQKPAVFILFDASQYLNLLPYLSTDDYDWQQVQK